jgi:crossover junction endodeoxyribonuclease RusA
MTIIVYGTPAPQGSKRHVGNGVLVESSEKVKPWRQDVKYAALKWRGDIQGWVILDGPVRLRMVFTLPKPKSAPKRKTWACKKPVIDKLLRSTLDGLTEAGVFTDDARVIEFSRLAKVFPGEDPEALDLPGVRIDVEAISC